MKYFSTRDVGKDKKLINFRDAVMMGLAEDGGLLLPTSTPRIDLASLVGLTYPEVAFEIIKEFATDIPKEELQAIINASYTTFRDSRVVPLRNIGECYIAELFHGETYAFKDIALQFLGNLFEHILRERGSYINIVGATSGDTGSAAIAGVKGRDNIKITILYPNGRVSPIQELQMTTTSDVNVNTLAVEGTFDDCQNIVKRLFADVELKKRYNLGAVNSINWARIMAQIVYYFYTYVQLDTDDDINYVVPSGNFGNIFAGYCAVRMGLPVKKLVLATNENDVLHRFISAGDYSLSDVKPTHSPSMDIQAASNFERYLYYLFNEDSSKVKSAMQEFRDSGKITFTDLEIERTQYLFSSYSVSNFGTEQAIKRIYKLTQDVIDPHTACGVQAAYKLNLEPSKTIVLSTAHPAKFADVIEKTLGDVVDIPAGMAGLEAKEKRVEVIANDYDLVKDRIVELFNK